MDRPFSQELHLFYPTTVALEIRGDRGITAVLGHFEVRRAWFLTMNKALSMQNKALTRNETEKENVQTPLSSRKGVTSNGSSRTTHRSRHRGINYTV